MSTSSTLPTPVYALIALALVAAVVPFAPALGQLYDIWNLQPEYSYGYIIPLISLYLIWRQRYVLAHVQFTGSWWGLALILTGLLLRVVGELTTMYTVVHYAFLLVLYGLILSFTGAAVFRKLWMPLLVLVFMVPLPSFFTDWLSLRLQLVSSALGVLLIRAAGISVLLEGNVIDLGSYQLQVAEACDGLRYLFPLMTLAFIAAYVFQGPMWKRVLVFLCSVPIAVVMNSLRIGGIGITVEYWGSKMAEGLLHDFEGWVVFMFSTAALMGVAALLAKVGPGARSWRETFDLSPPTGVGDGSPHGSSAAASVDGLANARGNATHGASAHVSGPSVLAHAKAGKSDHVSARPIRLHARRIPRHFVAATVLIAAGATAGFAMPTPHVMAPSREEFVDFPAHVGNWVGNRSALEKIYLDQLKLDDYVLADYRGSAGVPINFYAAWYDAQSTDRAVHSPRKCIPGGGWEIRKLERRMLPANGSRPAFPVNRAVIQFGTQKQLVYYWFQQRGRFLTNEYVVKWYLLWDAFTRHRTDGALVRIIAPLTSDAKEGDIEAEMQRFAALIEPQLSRFVPE